jgi:GNAT superfamily N-acetyltransferase
MQDVRARDTDMTVPMGISNRPIGFLGLAGDAIEALFLEPAHRRQGGGRRLVAHAQALRGGALTVDVNEQNIAARSFYEALGFEVVGRSSLDPTGRPHPLLHMRRSAARGDATAWSPRQIPGVLAPGPSANVTTPVYTITKARPRDQSLLPATELAATRLLAGHAPESVLAETTADEALKAAQAHGHLWVALAEDVPVGFAHVDVLEPTVAHLEEIGVHPEHGRRGLGKRLVMAVCAWAETAGYRAVTLTTFRDVPFNMPFYARLGFEVIPREELSSVLRVVVQDETCRGLDPARRVTMRRSCAVHKRLDAAEHECGVD